MDACDKPFPHDWIGPHYIGEDHGIVDRRVIRYEYRVNLETKKLEYCDLVSEYINGSFGEDHFIDSVMKCLDEDYKRLAKKSDFVAMEYYKKQILPEYSLEVSQKDIAELKKYPSISKKYKEAKKWLEGINESAMLDLSKEERESTVNKFMEILSETYLEK